MTTTLRASGVDVEDLTVDNTKTLTPSFPVTLVATDIAIMTVTVEPSTGVTVDTPTGWTRIADAEVSDDYSSSGPWYVATFFKKGVDSGTESVDISSLDTLGVCRAAIDVYERTKYGWTVDAYEDDYSYTAPDGQVYTGHNLFLEISDTTINVDVEFNENLNSPGFIVTVRGVDDYDAVTVYAQDVSGTYEDIVVRGADEAAGTPTFTVTDYEFPNFDSVRYYVEGFIADALNDTGTSDTQTEVVRDWLVEQSYYPMYNSWLRSVLVPALSVPCFIVDVGDRTRTGRVLNQSEVLGIKYPRVTTDVMGARTGSFSFFVAPASDWPATITPRDIDALMESGETLMLHHVDGVDLFEDPTYIIVTDFKRHRLGKYLNGIFQYDVTYLEVERPPSSDRVDVNTWQQVNDNNVDWQAVRDNHTSWLDVLLNP